MKASRHGAFSTRNVAPARIITVPQDPVLIMTDTVRQNLDIAGANVSDDDIVRVRERVRLWNVLQARGASAEAAGREAREVNATMGLVAPAAGGGSSGGNGATSFARPALTTPDDKKPLLPKAPATRPPQPCR